MGDLYARSQPGKTTPRLIADLLDYDPRYRSSEGTQPRNILADSAPQFRGQLIERTGALDCHHALQRKDSQSSCPTGKDQSFDGTETWTVASYCRGCKQHFTVTANYNNSRQTCNLHDAANPLHHLITTKFENGKEYAARKQSEGTLDLSENLAEYFRFECSAEYCRLQVEIKIAPPRLFQQYCAPILDPVKVVARGEREVANSPERYAGLSPVRPLQALGYLRTYIKDAKHASEMILPPRNIARRNKKYMLAFSDECEDLFQYLGFKSVEEVSDKGEGETETQYFWRPPVIGENNWKFYEDVLIELEAKMAERPQAEQQAGNTSLNLRPVLAIPDIERSLGCFDYPKRSRTIDLTKSEHPYYASLGAVDSMTDDILGWAYDRQCDTDPLNRPYYLDCLRDLARGRGSSDLDTKVAIAESAGEVGLQDIEEAYQFFGLNPNTTEGDSHLVGIYKSRIQSAPRQKDDARKMLQILAKARNSSSLEELANDKTMTYEEALEFLGVSSTTDADTIAAQATALSFDADKTKVILALRMIASRRSDYTLHVAISQLDDSVEPLLDINEAYKRLQIHQQSAPDSTVYTFYSSLSGGASAGSKESYTQALRAIAHHRQSNYLLQKLDDPNAEVKPEEVDLNQPVGLNNIGNTCYLNSLLQYFYTIKPVRDVALNLEEYRLPLNEEDIKQRRAGGRQNTRVEIAKGQRFTEELSDLFKNLKTAPARAIRPTVELADLSFFNEEVEETVRRASIASPNGPPKVFFGPEGAPGGVTSKPTEDTIPEDIEMKETPVGKEADAASDTSDSTLVDLDPAIMTKDAVVLEEKLPRTDTEQVLDSTRTTEDGPVLDSIISAPPDKPPPIPPRNKNGLSVSTSAKEKTSVPNDNRWFVGTQQDVDEVIRNTTWRMMCAIKPITTDPKTGEQSDKIRDTFYGNIATYLEKATKIERKVESWSSLLVYASEKKAIDIYEALDHTLDVQKVEVDKTIVPQFSSIAKLPPVLQIQINRTIFDTVKKQSVKVKGAVNFPETIYLDRYMDSSDRNSPLMRRRRQGWQWKSELEALEARLEALQNSADSAANASVLPANRVEDTSSTINVAEALNNTKDLVAYLQDASIPGIDIAPDLTSLLDERIAEIGLELENIRNQIEVLKRNLAEQFTDMRQYEYKLQAVFIHRGTAGAGHYWIYIYDFKNDIWREYNDERVEVVSNRKRIFDSSFADGATPYYLVYVRASDREELVDPVCREPVLEQVPVAPPVDTVMQDDSNGWTDVSRVEEEDEGIVMDDSDEGVSHVEHARPRPLRPKAQLSEWEEKLDRQTLAEGTDANGNRW